MEKILLFTNMTSIQKHWKSALAESYESIVIDNFEDLILYLQKNQIPITLLFDELSVSNTTDTIEKLKPYDFVNLLLFSSLPEVYHASDFLKEGINGYENSYIAKENLHKMIDCTCHGEKWFFSDLICYIINQYTRHTTRAEPDFMPLLTEREREVSRMIADGLSNKEIAQRTKISLSTVKGHIRHIFEKAKVSDRVSLALKFK